MEGLSLTKTGNVGSSVLVTGASGFIGSALVRHLAQNTDHRPIAALRPGSAQSRFGTEIPSHTASLEDTEVKWRPVLETTDVVVHAAGVAHRHHRLAGHGAPHDINHNGTARLAQYAATAGVRRFIFLSSISVHGTATHAARFTVHDTPQPQSPYAHSKLQAELAIQAVAERSGMEYVIIRPPLVYGPNAPGNFGLLTRLIRNKVPLPLADIENQRSLIGIDNLISLTSTCIDHPEARNMIFLAADGEDISTTALVERLAFHLRVSARLFACPKPLLRLAQNTPLLVKLFGSLQVDTTSTCQVLGWSPPASLDEGLRKAAQAR